MLCGELECAVMAMIEGFLDRVLGKVFCRGDF